MRGKFRLADGRLTVQGRSFARNIARDAVVAALCARLGITDEEEVAGLSCAANAAAASAIAEDTDAATTAAVAAVVREIDALLQGKA